MGLSTHGNTDRHSAFSKQHSNKQHPFLRAGAGNATLLPQSPMNSLGLMGLTSSKSLLGSPGTGSGIGLSPTRPKAPTSSVTLVKGFPALFGVQPMSDNSSSNGSLTAPAWLIKPEKHKRQMEADFPPGPDHVVLPENEDQGDKEQDKNRKRNKKNKNVSGTKKRRRGPAEIGSGREQRRGWGNKNQKNPNGGRAYKKAKERKSGVPAKCTYPQCTYQCSTQRGDASLFAHHHETHFKEPASSLPCDTRDTKITIAKNPSMVKDKGTKEFKGGPLMRVCGACYEMRDPKTGAEHLIRPLESIHGQSEGQHARQVHLHLIEFTMLNAAAALLFRILTTADEDRYGPHKTEYREAEERARGVLAEHDTVDIAYEYQEGRIRSNELLADVWWCERRLHQLPEGTADEQARSIATEHLARAQVAYLAHVDKVIEERWELEEGLTDGDRKGKIADECAVARRRIACIPQRQRQGRDLASVAPPDLEDLVVDLIRLCERVEEERNRPWINDFKWIPRTKDRSAKSTKSTASGRFRKGKKKERPASDAEEDGVPSKRRKTQNAIQMEVLGGSDQDDQMDKGRIEIGEEEL